jgi:iron-sulfur cluster assembly accessory protein
MQNIETSLTNNVNQLSSLASFFISKSAAERINHLLETEAAGAKLRIAVDGGGCSGFQYNFTFDVNFDDAEDVIFSENGADVVIDSISLDFIKGSMIDYVEDLGASYFEIKNPNSKSSCGCGNSFAV